MATQYTPILQLALPVTGELNGTWGDVVNDNITSMVEQAIAGMATISTWTTNSHTLTTANGTTDEARCAMLVAATGAGGTALTGAGEIVCPARTKLYVLSNTSAYTVTLKTAAGSGVAVPAGDTTFLFCDGTNVNACVTQIVNGHITGNLTVDGNTTLGNATSDTITAIARIASDLNPSADNTYDLGTSGNSWRNLYIDGTATIATLNVTTIDTTNLEVTNIKAKDGTAAITLADSTGVATLSAAPVLNAGTANQVQYLNGSKQLVGDADFTFDGTTLSATNITSSGSVTLSGGTANGVAYLNGSKVLTTGSALTFDGTNLGVGTASPQANLHVYGANQSISLNEVGAGGSGVASWRLKYGTSNWGAYVGSSNALVFYDYGANAEQMRLTSTGLGIGTSSPATALHVQRSSANATFALSSSGGTGRDWNISSKTDGSLTIGSDLIAGQLNLYAGNLGLGVTPSAWGTARAFQGYAGGFALSADGTNNNQMRLSSNTYFNGTNWIYYGSSNATSYEQRVGEHRWNNAPSGTAGNAISFTQAMTLDASGNFYVGTTSQVGGSNITFNNPSGNLKIAAAVSTGTNSSSLVFVNNTVTTIGTENSGGGTLASGTSAYSTVIANNGAYPISFATNNNERARIDSSGNVGIGTASPSYKLDITTTGGIRVLTSADLSTGGAAFLRFGGSNNAIAGYIGYGGAASTFDIANGLNGPITFNTSGSERMRIDSSGNLLVGTASLVYGSASNTTQIVSGTQTYQLVIRCSATTAGKFWHQGPDNGNSYCVYNQSNAGVYITDGGTSWLANSDERLKTELTPFENAAEKVASLRAGTGRYLADEEGVSRSFLIAQDVQKVLPEAVNTQDDEQGTLGLSYTDVIPLLVAAIKELKAELDATKAEVAALKGA